MGNHQKKLTLVLVAQTVILVHAPPQSDDACASSVTLVRSRSVTPSQLAQWTQHSL
jgi:hypothetical protein